MTLVQWKAELDAPVGAGTLRESLLSVERQTGKRDERLNEPDSDLPVEFEGYAQAVMAVFQSLSGGRQPGFSGPAPLGWSDMKAWCELNEIYLLPYEVQLLKMLDLVELNALAKQRKD
jgi:hypothetical protein